MDTQHRTVDVVSLESGMHDLTYIGVERRWDPQRIHPDHIRHIAIHYFNTKDVEMLRIN